MPQMDESKYRLEHGFIWPRNDKGCCAVCFDMRGLDIAYKYCKTFDVVVQAGGCVGVWPVELSKRFGLVYTFEPDPENFYCMTQNATDRKIIKFNAALGFRRGCVDMFHYDHNVGAHFISGRGPIPVLRIDDLGLDLCDLIYLDIEGLEHDALLGAADTIQRCRPVVAVEDKGLSERYGTKQGAVERLMVGQHGYQVVARPHRDIVFAPC